MTVLILAGTSEARALAAALAEADIPCVSSLAGRVRRPRLPLGEVRIGGFGGVGGLRHYVAQHAVTAVVDATHPFSERISANAALACRGLLPLLRLQRPGWSGSEGSEEWHWVADHTDAAAVARATGSRPMLTVGRQPLATFVLPLGHVEALVRVVDPPDLAVPAFWHVLLDRGPYTYDDERHLMQEHRVDVLVTKDSGGSHTRPKLAAARFLDVPVVVVRRPAPPPGVETVSDVTAALSWVCEQVVPR